MSGCAIFSLHESKAVSGGEGGILLTDDQRVFDRALLLGNARSRPVREVRTPELRDFVHTGFGLNYRIPALCAVLAIDDIRTLDERLLLVRKASELVMRYVPTNLARTCELDYRNLGWTVFFGLADAG